MSIRRRPKLGARAPLSILLGNVPDAVDYIFESTDEGHKQLSALGVEREESNVSLFVLVVSSLGKVGYRHRLRHGQQRCPVGSPFVLTFRFGKVIGPTRARDSAERGNQGDHPGIKHGYRQCRMSNNLG